RKRAEQSRLKAPIELQHFKRLLLIGCRNRKIP
ncbi:MAG: hypothetical protein ACI9VN_001093, partial [Patescibacteria group bacterium]